MADILITIGNNIEHYRNSCNYSIEQLALISNISTKQLSKIENGKQNTTIKTLEKIAHSLMIAPQTLLVSSVEQTNTSVFEEELCAQIVKSLKSLPEKYKQDFMTLFQTLKSVINNIE